MTGRWPSRHERIGPALASAAGQRCGPCDNPSNLSRTPAFNSRRAQRVRAIHREEGVTMARKSILATLLGVAAFAVPNAFADKGGVPHEGSNGQGRPVQEQQQTPAATPQGKALAKGHAKTHAK